MKIYSWNVNGIRAVHRKGVFDTFIAEHKPDILCLQETKAEEGQSPIDLPEYQEYWSSAHKKGYSGTAIFTKIESIRAIYGLPDEVRKAHKLEDKYGDTADEGRITTLEFDDFYVSSVYTPNAKDDLSRLPVREEWDQAYLAYMKQLQGEKPVIFCGDLNVAHTEIDLARPKENRGRKGFTDEERDGIDKILAAGFIDTLRLLRPGETELYTWWSHWGHARERNVGWRIDYIMASDSLSSLIKRASIHPEVLGSDHCPVSIEIGL